MRTLIPFLILCAALGTATGYTQPQAGSFTSTNAEALFEIERLHAKADELLVKNDFREAIALYWEIILLEPDDEMAYARMGQAYLILGDTDGAEDAFLNALDINPENDLAMLGLEKLRYLDGETFLSAP